MQTILTFFEKILDVSTVEKEPPCALFIHLRHLHTANEVTLA